MLLSSMAVAGWFVMRMISPWTHSIAEIRRMKADGAFYYRTSRSGDLQYGRLETVHHSLQRKLYDGALREIELGMAAAPNNPAFDYLQAAVYWQKGEMDSALKAIEAGNGKGTLRLYISSKVSPEHWDWSDAALIRQMGREIASDPAVDRRGVLSVLKMGQKMAWIEPPDMMRVMYGIGVRQSAAERLEALAEEDGDRDMARLCRDLIAEGQTLTRATSLNIEDEAGYDEDSRAWIIGRALRGTKVDMHGSATLLYMEKQAQRAAVLRKRYLKKQLPEGYGS